MQTTASKIRAVMKRLGEFTSAQLINEVSHLFSAAVAVKAYKDRRLFDCKRLVMGVLRKNNHTLETMVRRGRAILVHNYISRDKTQGFLVKVDKKTYRYVEPPPPALPLTVIILKTVAALGECSSLQVYFEVRDHIPPAQAMKAYKRVYLRHNKQADPRVSLENRIALGRRVLVSEGLNSNYRSGRIRRVVPGVFAPQETNGSAHF